MQTGPDEESAWLAGEASRSHTSCPEDAGGRAVVPGSRMRERALHGKRSRESLGQSLHTGTRHPDTNGLHSYIFLLMVTVRESLTDASLSFTRSMCVKKGKVEWRSGG